MKTIYLDCASGISGDMTLGALVDAGVELSAIQAGLDSLELPSCRLEQEEVKRHAFRATKVSVHHQPEHAHRHLHHITDMIDASDLNENQKQLAKRIFTRLGEAEAKVHGTTLRKVHFHEVVGAVDSIADIVGVAIGLDLIGAERVVCSPVPTGTGYIQIAHGRCSVPAPATAELLCDIPLAPSDVELELTTPTGAAIVATVASSFGGLPPMTVRKIGYGAGDNDLKQQANLLRLMVGEEDDAWTTADRIAVLETNLDDVTGEIVGYCTQRLLEEGALDVYTTSIQMKKNRPGCKLTVLCQITDATKMEARIFAETGSLGVRRWEVQRQKLQRETAQVNTSLGVIRGKKITLPSGETTFSPEFEDCQQIARDKQVTLQAVLEIAKRRRLNNV